MVSFVSLQSAFDALNNAKEDGQKEDPDRNPKGVPLNPLPSVPPSLPYCFRLSLVKYLLQDNESVAPAPESIDLSVVRS